MLNGHICDLTLALFLPRYLETTAYCCIITAYLLLPVEIESHLFMDFTCTVVSRLPELIPFLDELVSTFVLKKET